MAAVKPLAFILLIVGGVNWGLWGVAQFDLVATIFGGNTTMLARVVYSLVGLAAILLAVTKFSTGTNLRGAIASS
ncbi:MAG: DUF378 domain-containing protein [Phycisphaerales bacterium]|nr:DUF378 domain-containing protein [Phycisphaerales bacterium]